MSLKSWSISECPLLSLVDGESDLWTRSPDTFEYYYNGNNPVILPPSAITIGENKVVPQEVGSLEAGKWGFGNADGLDSDTFYVRLPLKSLSDGGSTDLWAQSGSGTAEYYYTGPEIDEPDGVVLGGSEASKTTPGSLAQEEWAYGDNDSLGYTTIYVRLSGDADPDAQAADYVQSVVDPDDKPADYIITPQPHVAVQKNQYTECILMSVLVSNPSTTKDTRVWFYIADQDDNILFKWFVDLASDSSPFALDTKQVLNDQDRFVVITDVEEVCVFVSGDEE